MRSFRREITVFSLDIIIIHDFLTVHKTIFVSRLSSGNFLPLSFVAISEVFLRIWWFYPELFAAVFLPNGQDFANKVLAIGL